MKSKSVFTFVLLFSIAFAAFDNSFDTFEDIDDNGCTFIDDELWCVEPGIVFEVEATTTDDLWCYSTEAFENEDFSCSGSQCAEYIDIGCLTMIYLENDIDVELTWVTAEGIYTNSEMEIQYGTVTVVADEYMSGVNTDLVDFSQCSYDADEVAVFCPFEGRRLFFDGGVIGDDVDIGFMIMNIAGEGAISVDFMSFFVDNIIYIALIVIIAIAAIQILRPKKSGAKQKKKPRKPI
jgi:hypothetical protein